MARVAGISRQQRTAEGSSRQQNVAVDVAADVAADVADVAG